MYNKIIEELPIFNHLGNICEQLKNSPSRFMLLEAETGAGKSTALPAAILNYFDGNIIVTEPRRLSVINVAKRSSFLINEDCGLTIGYKIRYENCVSKSTRLTVVTDAILLNMIQNNPMLDGINVIVIDEAHERSVNTDLTFALLKEIMELRDDLYVLVMSASINTQCMQKYLNDCPVYKVEGRMHEVEQVYGGTNVYEAVKNELYSTDAYSNGSILVFLPGIGEIRRLQEQLAVLDCEILVLHSSISFNEQQKVFEKSNKRRIILSSAIAETSLTIPDVTVVMDTGLSRISSFDLHTGLSKLITVKESEFNSIQRKGRAGRVQKGKYVQLWDQKEKLNSETVPEICRTDLSEVVLKCAEWGSVNINDYQWLTKPDEKAWKNAEELLQLLGCLKGNTITELGKATLCMGTDIRIALACISGIVYGDTEFSTEIAAKILKNTDSSSESLENLRKDLKRRLQKVVDNYRNSSSFPQKNSTYSTGFPLFFAFPDKIAKKTVDNEYRLYSGKTAILGDSEKNLLNHEYLAVIDADAGREQSYIRYAIPLDLKETESFIKERAAIKTRVCFVNGDKSNIKKSEQLLYGKIVLSEKNLSVSPEDYKEAVCDILTNGSLFDLPMNDRTRIFIKRFAFYIDKGKDFFTENSAEYSQWECLNEKYNSICENAREWLLPFITGKLTEEAVQNALFWYLESNIINKYVPEEILLENGKKRKLVYEEINGKTVPVLEVIIQHIFGCFTNPEIMGEKVLLRLLSPARRPLQVTTDLEGFWNGSWKEICKEMKGRYPKHNWEYTVCEDE